MAPRNPGWITDADGSKSWPLDSYQMEGERITHWLAEGVIKQHRTGAGRRTGTAHDDVDQRATLKAPRTPVHFS